MSSASPAANSADAATGATWFKVWEDPPVYENGALVFPSQTIDQFTFTIPEDLPSGQYLVRGEQIALHVASTFGGAQFYLGCAQINVVNGGSGSPSPLVSIPGVYTGYEPGILINIYDLPADYPGYQSRKCLLHRLPICMLIIFLAGPAVWSG
ncbi:putative endo-beta-1,4-glucanase D [Grifola frondosa]|uniref:lytic cellulose monooxygenase (C4-dehydrogenating) n=1 Tax=Grifola frondosa TaxID=5627 RepID=A0A1C7LRW9_GRIFR|nr:putative endo-beta-1,4-glucanase D [Grifola frondosa]